MPTCRTCGEEKDFDDAEFLDCQDCDPSGTSAGEYTCGDCGIELARCRCGSDEDDEG